MQYQVLNDRLLSGGRAVPFVPTPNQGGRIEPALIVVHFTADHLDPKDSVNWFAQKKSKVSAHIVLGRDGEITQMVDFDRRAFHCDPSEWNGRRGVNGFSIGIEVDNPGALRMRGKDGAAWFGTLFDREQYELVEHKSDKYGHALWMPYTEAQLDALRGIIQALLRAYPSIIDIRGHDEICVPAKRKNDPGPLMDMDGLRTLLDGRAPDDVKDVTKAQKWLVALGYEPGDIDGQISVRTRSALRIFQEQNGLLITGNLDTATWQLLSDGTGKRMPTGNREAAPAQQVGAEFVAKRTSEGTFVTTVVEAAADPTPALPVDPLSALDTADKAIAHAEKGKAVVDRSTGILDWLIAYLQTPQGLRVALTLTACIVVWLAVHHRERFARLLRLGKPA